MAAPILFFASCDTFYGVIRRASPPPGFDPAGAQEILRQQPGFDAVSAQAWDGASLWCPFEIDGAVAAFGYQVIGERNTGIELASLWVGREPDAAVLRRTIQLQDTLLRILSERLPAFPVENAFTREWVNMKPPNEVR